MKLPCTKQIVNAWVKSPAEVPSLQQKTPTQNVHSEFKFIVITVIQKVAGLINEEALFTLG